ncbi:MAG: HAD family hydrolase [Candidatus Omnitrophica bacterium]|nr:HAD family hydrolase [Candidatus Omnitrophota bacterium]
MPEKDFSGRKDRMKLVFLDRDGVISDYTPNDYVKSREEFNFLPSAIDGLKKLVSNCFQIIIISNQAGVNKGLLTMETLDDITKKMQMILKSQGINVLKAYYCPHTTEENCECRKPRAGLFQQADNDFGPIDFSKAFFIGDSSIDIEAGKNIGAKTILVLSGKTKSEEETKEWKCKPDYTAKTLLEAAEIVISSP